MGVDPEMASSSRGGNANLERNSVELKVDLVWRKREDKKLDGGALIEKIVSDKNLNAPTVIQMIRKGWNIENHEDLEIVEIDRKTFVFEFRRRADYVRILRGRPWSINSLLLNIQRWEEDMTFSEVNFNFSPFWIQFHDLPPAVMDFENALTLGKMIGDVMMAEDPRKDGLLVRSFLRARVLVDLRKPLVSGMWSPKPGKEPIKIKVRYERLQNFCYICGRIGHDLRGCPHKENPDSNLRAEYGNWLSVQAARWNEEIVRPIRMEWEEVEDWTKEKSIRSTKGSIRREEIGLRDGESLKEHNRKEVWRGELKNEIKLSTNTEKYRKSDKDIKTVDIESEGKGGMEGKKCDLINRVEGCGRRDEKERESKYIQKTEGMTVSNAMVVYGSISPVDEMLTGMQKFSLKRQGEELEDVQVVKRMKTSINCKSVENGLMKQYVTKKGDRRSVRIQKRKSRVGGIKISDMNGDVKGDRMEDVEGDFVFSSKAIVMTELDCTEGGGDWPKSVTKAP